MSGMYEKDVLFEKCRGDEITKKAVE